MIFSIHSIGGNNMKSLAFLEIKTLKIAFRAAHCQRGPSQSGNPVVHVEETTQYTSGGYGKDGPGSEPIELNKGEAYDFESPA